MKKSTNIAGLIAVANSAARAHDRAVEAAERTAKNYALAHHAVYAGVAALLNSALYSLAQYHRARAVAARLEAVRS